MNKKIIISIGAILTIILLFSFKNSANKEVGGFDSLSFRVE